MRNAGGLKRKYDGFAPELLKINGRTILHTPRAGDVDVHLNVANKKKASMMQTEEKCWIM